MYDGGEGEPAEHEGAGAPGVSRRTLRPASRVAVCLICECSGHVRWPPFCRTERAPVPGSARFASRIQPAATSRRRVLRSKMRAAILDTRTGGGWRQFIVRVRKWARARELSGYGETNRCLTPTTIPPEVERDEDGRYVAAFPDFGWGATDGATRDEALLEARWTCFGELIATTMREGGDTCRTAVARIDPAPADGRTAGADSAEGGPLRGVPQGRGVETPLLDGPRSRCRRERGAAHAESGSCHQGGHHRPRLAPVGEACQRDRGVRLRDRLPCA